MHLTWQNDFCLYRSKHITSWCKFKPWTLWIVHAYGNVSGNYVRLMVKDFFLILNEASVLSIGTHWCLRDRSSCDIALNPAWLSSKETYILVIFPAADLIYFTTPIYSFVNLSFMSILLISITLAPIFKSNWEERFPVSVGFLALNETSCSSHKVTPLGNWLVALNRNH